MALNSSKIYSEYKTTDLFPLCKQVDRSFTYLIPLEKTEFLTRPFLNGGEVVLAIDEKHSKS